MWNYRLVQSKEDNTVVLAEVYYNDDGTPYGFAEAGVLGEDTNEAREVYDMMKEAFTETIIDEDKDIRPFDDGGIIATL